MVELTHRLRCLRRDAGDTRFQPHGLKPGDSSFDPGGNRGLHYRRRTRRVIPHRGFLAPRSGFAEAVWGRGHADVAYGSGGTRNRSEATPQSTDWLEKMGFWQTRLSWRPQPNQVTLISLAHRLDSRLFTQAGGQQSVTQ
ncbi:MAG: hypothetical protein EXS25_12050 [Pedosphaera sp.]|nr:hypothetical protein [Pedosphaera sp.]